MKKKNFRVRPGDLVEVHWLDAAFLVDEGDEGGVKAAIKRGGFPRKNVGWLQHLDDKIVVIASELETYGVDPSNRDYNVIPRGIITKIRRIETEDK